MRPLNLDEVNCYVNENIINFHLKRCEIVSTLSIKELIRKNPYLFRAKNVTKASELIEGTLAAFLSSSEEKLFGDFLEGLAIFVAEKTADGMKSASQGIDLEFFNEDIHYVVSIKSGPNWGNSSQHKKLGEDFVEAIKRIRQANRKRNAEAVLGICYGRTKTTRNRKFGYLKVVGQNFWTFISGNKDLYTEIIEPLGYKAKENNEKFLLEQAKVINLLTKRFIDEYCEISGEIDWKKLIRANSQNFDLDSHGFEF